MKAVVAAYYTGTSVPKLFISLVRRQVEAQKEFPVIDALDMAPRVIGQEACTVTRTAVVNTTTTATTRSVLLSIFSEVSFIEVAHHMELTREQLENKV